MLGGWLRRLVPEKCCKEAIALKADPDPVLQIATCSSLVASQVLTPEHHQRALRARHQGPSVAGASHQVGLMTPAQGELSADIDAVKDKMQPPCCAIHFNVTARKVAAGPVRKSEAHRPREVRSPLIQEMKIRSLSSQAGKSVALHLSQDQSSLGLLRVPDEQGLTL